LKPFFFFLLFQQSARNSQKKEEEEEEEEEGKKNSKKKKTVTFVCCRLNLSPRLRAVMQTHAGFSAFCTPKSVGCFFLRMHKLSSAFCCHAFIFFDKRSRAQSTNRRQEQEQQTAPGHVG